VLQGVVMICVNCLSDSRFGSQAGRSTTDESESRGAAQGSREKSIVGWLLHFYVWVLLYCLINVQSVELQEDVLLEAQPTKEAAAQVLCEFLKCILK